MVLYSATSQDSKPMPSDIPWVATAYSAGTHEAEFEDQWCKQKGWAFFYKVPQEFLSLELFVCYGCKIFVQDVRL